MSLVRCAHRHAARRIACDKSSSSLGRKDFSHQQHIQSLNVNGPSRPSLQVLRLEEWRRWSSTAAVVSASDALPRACEASSSSSSSSSNDHHHRFLEFLGVSLLAVGTSALASWSFPSQCPAPTAPLKRAECETADAGCTSVLVDDAPDKVSEMLATSALYMDPRSMIYSNDHNPAAGGTKRGESDLAAAAPASIDNLSERPYDLSVRAIKGARLTMEDTYCVAPGGRFVAVFDGHGGPSVSSYLKDNLYQLAKQALKKKHWEIDNVSDEASLSGLNAALGATLQTTKEDNNYPKGSKTSISLPSHVAALRTAFTQAEEHVLKQRKWEKQGSTAVAVWMHENMDGNRTLVSANVGDSRAILSRQGVAVDLTRDHKPNEEREKSRIKRLGGTIEWDALAKVHRVGGLSLSRAIGDSFAKPIVSSEVDIKLFPVVEGKDEFFLLASDGLWDVFTSQECVNYVKDRFETELAREELSSEQDVENCRLVVRRNMARSLCKEAVRRGSGDNICVLIVWLKDGDIMTASASQPQQ